MKVLNDLLWDGDLKIFQETENFKFSIDSVLLSNFITLNKTTQRILDIGTGNAPIPLMLTKRTNAFIDAIEIQNISYDLAVESVKYNCLDDRINLILGDIKKEYLNIENNYYDAIISNPPYFKSNMKKAFDENKRIARSEEMLTLQDIFRISRKILKDGGNIAIVNDTDRLVEIIKLMKENSIEPKKIQFIFPKENKNSKFFLIEGTKNGKPGIKVLNPVIIQNENNEYTEYIENILKNFGKY